MKTYKLYYIIFSIVLSTVVLISCKEKTYPDLEECMKYSNDEEKCRNYDGCMYTGGYKTKFVNHKCIGMEFISCLPVDNLCLSSIEDSYFKVNEDGTIESIRTANSCKFTFGDGWKHSRSDYPTDSTYVYEGCYQKQDICNDQPDKDSCLDNYCAWVSKGYKAIIENDQCTGWDATPISGCFSTYRPYDEDLPSLNPKMWQTYSTNDGTIMMKVIDSEYSIETDGRDPSTIYCLKDGINQPEICNCPDPPE